MSGPKDADWYLSEEERLRRAEERRIRLEQERRDRELTNEIEELKNSIKEEISNKNHKNIKFIESLNKYELEASIVKEREEIARNIEVNSRDILNKSDCYTIGAKEAYLKELNNLGEYINDKYDEIDKLNYKLFYIVNENTSKEFINKINSGSLDFNVKRNDSLSTKSEEKLKSVINEFNKLFNRYCESKYLSEKVILKLKKKEVDNLIKEVRICNDYKVNQIQAFIKDIYRKEEEYLKEEEINKEIVNNYNSLFASYEILREKLDVEVKFTKSRSIEIMKSQFRDLEIEVERLNNCFSEIEDYDYIVQSIDEVMEELGYDILSSEVLNRVNRNIVDSIYSFDDNSVLNLFTSDNGTIMFEVTGISNEKREISSLEKLKLKESMNTFCGKYDAIKKKLAERGIFFGAENLRPADERYARIRVVNENRYKVKNISKATIRSNKSRYIK